MFMLYFHTCGSNHNASRKGALGNLYLHYELYVTQYVQKLIAIFLYNFGKVLFITDTSCWFYSVMQSKLMYNHQSCRPYCILYILPNLLQYHLQNSILVMQTPTDLLSARIFQKLGNKLGTFLFMFGK